MEVSVGYLLPSWLLVSFIYTPSHPRWPQASTPPVAAGPRQKWHIDDQAGLLDLYLTLGRGLLYLLPQLLFSL